MPTGYHIGWNRAKATQAQGMYFFSPIINSNSSQSAYDHELLDKTAQVKTKWNSFQRLRVIYVSDTVLRVFRLGSGGGGLEWRVLFICFLRGM